MKLQFILATLIVTGCFILAMGLLMQSAYQRNVFTEDVAPVVGVPMLMLGVVFKYGLCGGKLWIR